jgi:hypothetical protein
MTTEEVKSLLKQKNLEWEDFLEYMAGQTVGMNGDGSADYFERDVTNFIQGNYIWD